MTRTASPVRRASHFGSRRTGYVPRKHNSTNDDGGVFATPGPTGDCRQNRRRQNTLMRKVSTLTIPATAGGERATQGQMALDVTQPNRPGALTALNHAIDLGLSPKAYQLYAVAVLRATHDEWLTLEDLAYLAGFTHHEARPLARELVAAGLLQQRRWNRIVGDRKVNYFRYLVAVTS